MESTVKTIHLTANYGNQNDFDPQRGNTDVVVSLDNGEKYIASFFAYANIEDMRNQHQKDGEFLKVSYFWDKNMILIEECSLTNIESVINDIIDEGNFMNTFRHL